MKIKNFRLTYIWTEAMPELFSDLSSGKMTECIVFDTYKKTFNELMSGVERSPFDIPWPRATGATLSEGNNFWNSTLFKSFRDHRDSDKGGLAWKAAIPFRRKTSLGKIKRKDRCFFEGWYFPLGAAVTLTAWVSGSYDGKQMIDEIAGFERDQCTVEWDDGRVDAGDLRFLARRALDRMRGEGFDLPPGEFSPDCLTIITVISADRTAGDKAEAAANLKLLLGAVGRVGKEAPPVGDIHLPSDARVIWRPDRFDSAQAGSHTLGCLHRNVTVATLYVAALIRSVEIMVAAFIDNGNQVPPKFEPYARAVAGLLGRIYGGEQNTYKLPILRSQIGSAKQAVDRLRQRLDMTALQ